MNATIPIEHVPLHNKDGSPCLDEQGLPMWRSITPLWNAPGEAGIEIPQRYEAAIIALAKCEFFARKWDKESESKFFMIRNQFIKTCEAACKFDWQATKDFHEFRRTWDREAKGLAVATRRFRKSLNAKASQETGAPQKLAYILWAAFEQRSLDQDDLHRLTSTVPSKDIMAALDCFADQLDVPRGRGSGHFGFGPVHYHAMPKRLPEKEVALALKLADVFTTWRADSKRIHAAHSGRPANLSRDTPWSVTTLFVDAALKNRKPTRNLQKRVQAAIEAGARIG